MDYITPIKSELDKNMHIHCGVFCTIGTPNETPRYYNFGGFDIETKVLTIASSQSSRLFFRVQTAFDYVDCTEFWQQFKEYRTKFLQENYPTISIY